MGPPRILLVYHSAEGQTAKVADRIATTMRSAGADVDMADAIDAEPPNGHDGIVLGDSIHMGRHSRPLERYIGANAEAIGARPLALFQVSLTSASDDDEDTAEANRLVRELVEPTGLDPELVGLFAGALAYTRYGWFKRRLMRRFAEDNKLTDVSIDHEYTDWGAVEQFARDAVAVMAPERPQP